MSRKAVDVVLLPEEAMTDRVIGANAELVKKFGRKIVLNKRNCLPHISLAMGTIDETDIGNIEKILKAIAKESFLEDFKIVGVHVETNAVGQQVSAFIVEKTDQIQLLHERIMNGLAPCLSSDVDRTMMYPGGEIAESTLLWIRNYREKSSFENFSPHITIGYGQMQNRAPQVEFAASKLALCHMGNHCTCREIFVSMELK
jgi:2'-5' RNA ligase